MSSSYYKHYREHQITHMRYTKGDKLYNALTSKASFCCHFKILDSMSSKLKPFVSGTDVTMNTSDTKAMAAKRRKRLSAPRYSCSGNQHTLQIPKVIRQC